MLRVLSGSSRSNVWNFRLHSTSLLVEGRAQLLLLLIRSSILLMIASAFSDGLPRLLLVASYIYYGTMAIGILTGLLLSCFRIPFPISSDDTLSRFIAIVFSTLGLAGGLNYALTPLLKEETAVVSYQVAGLFLALFYLIPLLLEGREPALCKLLTEIRRDLALGKVSDDVARLRLEIVVAGMTVGDFLEEDTSKLLKLFQDQDIEYREILTRVEAAESLLSKSIRELGKEEVVFLKSSIESAWVHAKASDEKQKEIDGSFKKFERRLKWIASLPGCSHSAIGEVVDKIRDGLVQPSKTWQELKPKLEGLQVRYDIVVKQMTIKSE